MEAVGAAGRFGLLSTLSFLSECPLRILAIETSERVGSLAALEPVDNSSSVVGRRRLSADRRSAQTLLPAIQTLLDDCRWQPQQLDLICVATGPGSFTGLRIGVTTAKTLAYATGAKLVEVHTLAASAARVEQPYSKLWTLLDAQRQELFAAHFEPDWQLQSNFVPQTRIMSIERWLQAVQPGDLVSGPPLSNLAAQLPAGVLTTNMTLWPPQADTVGHLGVAAFRAGQVVDPMQLVPHYYRKSAAEEKADRKV